MRRKETSLSKCSVYSNRILSPGLRGISPSLLSALLWCLLAPATTKAMIFEIPWTYQPDDFVVVLVESTQQPPDHMLQAEVSVWAARKPQGPKADLKFQLTTAGIPAFRWSTATFHNEQANPQPRAPIRLSSYPPPKDFYGENGHVPPGIYFLSYARLDQGKDGTESHRIGLADKPCRRNGNCSVEICVPTHPTGICGPNAEKRTGIQFHKLFRNPKLALSSEIVPESSDISRGCLTTTEDFLEKIFPESITDPQTSPFRWNGARKNEQQDLGNTFQGDGNALIFVVESLSPGAVDQAQALLRWLRTGRLTPDHFRGGPDLERLRRTWWRLARDRAVEVDEAASSYVKALDESTKEILGSPDIEIPWTLLGYSTTLEPSVIAAIDFRESFARGSAPIRSFEMKAQLRLAKGLAATEWSEDEIAAKLNADEAGESFDAEALGATAIALRESGVVSKLPNLPAAIHEVASFAAVLEETRKNLTLSLGDTADLSTANLELGAALEALREGVARIDVPLSALGDEEHEVGVEVMERANSLADTAIEVRRTYSAIEDLLSGREISEAEVDALIESAPEGIQQPAKRVVAAYRGVQALQSLQDQRELTKESIGQISAGVGAVVSACGMKPEEARTLETALNVGLSLASGNYVGAAMALVGGTSSRPDPNAIAFAQINAKLDALLEGQRKILERLDEIEASIRTLETKLIRQHWEVLTRLTALETGLILNRRYLAALFEKELKQCDVFFRWVQDDAADDFLMENRDLWRACKVGLATLGPSPNHTVSPYLRFESAAVDAPEIKGVERPRSAQFLEQLAFPIFSALSRFGDHRNLLLQRAAFSKPSSDHQTSVQFVDTEIELILSTQGLLAADRVLSYAIHAQEAARFWLSGECVSRGICDLSGDSEAKSAAEVLNTAVSMVNESIAQQNLLSGFALFAPEHYLGGLPVTEQELFTILDGRELSEDPGTNLARMLLILASEAVEVDFAFIPDNATSDPNWPFTKHARLLASVRFTTAAAPDETTTQIRLRFERQLAKNSESYSHYMVIESEGAPEPKASRIELLKVVLQDPVIRNPALHRLNEARRQIVQLLALTKLSRSERVSLLTPATIN